ncbi:MAG: ATP-binding cassette domain-containing protein, partial [Burkholderiales bacterium]|nr:ATP-binding cassette domain-containing protein [Burkholderiales bacterium]
TPAAGVRIELAGVERAFGTLRVLKGLDLEIRPGEFVAVVGRSGCGKSTLLRLLAGLDEADGGSIRFDGEPIAQAKARGDVRIMFQEPRLLPWKTVLQNVAIGLGPGSLGEARAALARVGLEDKAGQWPANLSGGQRQRAALARALLHQPRLLLLDEPLGALDALTRIEMQKLIEELWLAQGFTALLVTHDVQEAIALADRVILIEAGRIGLDLRVHLARPRSRGTAEFAALEGAVLDRVMNNAPALPLNAFRGKVTSIESDRILAEVRVLTPLGVLTALLPAPDVTEQDLHIGDEVLVHLRPTSIALARVQSGMASNFYAGPGWV